MEQFDTTIKRVFDRELKRTIESSSEFDDTGKWAENVAKKVAESLVDRTRETLEKYIEPIGTALYDIDKEERTESRKVFKKRAIQRLKQGKWDVPKKA
jgi:hypothetical protein